jgi:type II secretory pathway component PulF
MISDPIISMAFALPTFDDADSFGLQLVLFGAAVAIELALVCAALYVFYVVLTLPMRRNERARLFLDLLELGLKEGHSPEKAIIDAASSRDRSPGARFHLLAAHLQQGMKLSDALVCVPRLLPPEMSSILKAGVRIGDVGKVLPACRRLLNDGVSQVRGALNYLLILAFLIVPAITVIPLMINTLIVPKFKEVYAGLGEGTALPAFTQFVFSNGSITLNLQIAIAILCWLCVFAYVGGPRLRQWLRAIDLSLLDYFLFRLPWRRRRLQRNFSAMLAVLLDSNVPEVEAVLMAAEATNNAAIQSRAQRVNARLAAGDKLSVAIRTMDDSGELEWRLSNALRRGRGFLSALTGWHEALDARAFQAEQTAAQVTSTALVLFTGFMVACIVIAMFLPLIALIDKAVLW